MKEFDYYIFIDYSENLIGYSIIEKKKLKELLPKISKFSHFKELKHKREYLHSIKRIIDNENVLSDIFKIKIREMRHNLNIYTDVLNFIKNHNNCIIFISIDNHEFSNFVKLVNIADGERTKVVKESQLKEKSIEYRLSLILDTLLNIERLRKKNG
ncbi:hypothetical protein COU57_01355 [Candidatus Pacearchaeota archaeon CG10_big_fil_rev_8_21_14_0_10_32_14]|nr:MAG: hypothetical protein COU57_01355 [Candidatus Pacearchaeota archaeon CG10_big_fil_rev_8_21_14_0_10_32_14]